MQIGRKVVRQVDRQIFRLWIGGQGHMQTGVQVEMQIRRHGGIRQVDSQIDRQQIGGNVDSI